MKIPILAAAALLALAPAGFAQAPAVAPAAGPAPELVRLPAKAGGKLTVTSPAFKTGGDIPFENTQYRGNVFPGLAWTAGPKGTRSYAVIMQDTDRPIPGGLPLLHWSMFNIAATARALPPGMIAPPAGASNGPNYKGPNQAYLGPRTPPGPKHHYHFQVYALDTTVTEANPTFAVLTAAMKDHVLASGEVVGLGRVDPDAPPRPATPPSPAAPPPK